MKPPYIIDIHVVTVCVCSNEVNVHAGDGDCEICPRSHMITASACVRACAPVYASDVTSWSGGLNVPPQRLNDGRYTCPRGYVRLK